MNAPLTGQPENGQGQPIAPQSPLQDPLLQYSREELVALIQQQADENQVQRDQAEQFERLYLDIIHSTSWKLAWPIRAAFKVLSLGRDLLRKRHPRQPGQAESSTLKKGQSNQTGLLEAALSQLLFFQSPSAQPRLNLLVSQHLEPSSLEHLLTVLTRLCSQYQAVLRLISLDPALTARDCQTWIHPKTQPAPVDFVFHDIQLTYSARSPFRLEWSHRDLALSLSRKADETLAKIVPAERRLIIEPGTEAWTSQLVRMLGQISEGVQA